MNFVPLHVYSGYSFHRSGLKIEQYVEEAKKLGFETIGLSDYETLSGAPVIYHEADNNHMKVIIGEDLFIDNLLFSFYVLNEQGYSNLLKLSLEAKSEKATLDTIKEYQEGLAIILTSENEAFKKSIKDSDFAKKISKVTRGIENFYFGLEMSQDGEYIELIRDFIFNHGYKCLAFPSIKYIKKEDAIILKMMESIDSKEVLNYKKLDGEEYLKSLDELKNFYTEDELKATEELANNVDFKFISQRGKMISWKNPDNISSDDYLEKISKEGLAKRGKTSKEYIDRLNYELKTIKDMGYSDYFLIVQDYINYARDNNIAVGPGRGSASGSLVSYALGITVPDPIEHKLLFERFLNPARQTMPDIDVDFSDIHREDIINFLRDKYGVNQIARIIAIQKMGAKAALNDVGRIFNYEKHDIELFTKLIKDESDDKLTLREIYKTNKKFRDLVNNDPYYLEIVSLASKIEGMPRQSSLHAVGIVLNADSLIGTIPLTNAFDGGFTEEFEKDYLEEQGFLKMDILAIRNLTIIEDCLSLLKLRGINIDRDSIPYDDPDALKVIAKAKTMGLFQLESAGMRNAIKTLKIKKFEDLVQLLALYRPGPMDSIPDFANKKNSGIKPKYLSPALEEILSPTYGTIVYQEQIMQIASKMAGFTLNEADSFRRAVSKKDSKKLEGLRKSFVDGALKNGYKEKEATDVFNLIDKFANYGFNRSHSLVYAIFSSRMAYLKAHYPAEFYASILSNASTTEFNNTISEMKELKIKVICPDINESESYFKLIGNNILFPLGSVRGISGVTMSNILNERNSGKFKDLYDFVVRMSKYRFSDAQLMSLIDAGAFDCFSPSRATLRNSVAGALSYASALINDEGILAFDPTFLPKPSMLPAEDDLLENLHKEFNALGLMVSGSPLDAYKDVVSKIGSIKIDQIESSKGDVKILSIIKNVRRTVTKKDKRHMAFITIYDDTKELELTIFPDTYEKCEKSIKIGNVVVVSGYYSYAKEEFVLKEIKSLEEISHE